MRKRRGRRVNATGRNGDEQFIPVSYPMAKSLAWRALSGAAVKVWIELRARYNGGNNGELSLSLDEAAQLLRLGKATISRAFADLVEKGFVVLTRPGQWYGRQAALWRTTDRGTHGQPPTNDWKRWEPGQRSKGASRKKQSLGSEADHIEPATVPLQNRGPKSCSATEPVATVSGRAIGSKSDRLYNHALAQPSRRAKPLGERSATASEARNSPVIGPRAEASAPVPTGNVAALTSALPIGPATEAAMAEKRRAAS